MAPSPTFRIEHHTDQDRRVVEYLDDAVRHHRALDPYVDHLLVDGHTGWLVLIEQATGGVVARRCLRASPSEKWARQRRGLPTALPDGDHPGAFAGEA